MVLGLFWGPVLGPGATVHPPLAGGGGVQQVSRGPFLIQPAARAIFDTFPVPFCVGSHFGAKMDQK